MQTVIPLQPGQYYHIYNRGVNRTNIFVEERNYVYFLKLYAKHISPVAETFAYCLLRNHFHLLVRIRIHQTDAVSKTASVSTASVLEQATVLDWFSGVHRFQEFHAAPADEAPIGAFIGEDDD